MATPSKHGIGIGDAVVFHDRDTDRKLHVTVQQIIRYLSFENLLRSEDTTSIDPNGPPSELPARLRGIYPSAKEVLGVLTLSFDHRPARPSRPIPMTAEEYAQTVGAFRTPSTR
ncbi:ASCH domain-containing protein [Streptomyces tauricus]|uniref:hypothetical protein n=1 Tax=Streptomyces tauricus TaxID=68274 RepID=UPI002244A9F1|nr:hypothetical protein [Streptomyces tauricus]MCW8095856.1 hypothetical protein [Streptomyces tauricus]